MSMSDEQAEIVAFIDNLIRQAERLRWWDVAASGVGLKRSIERAIQGGKLCRKEKRLKFPSAR